MMPFPRGMKVFILLVCATGFLAMYALAIPHRWTRLPQPMVSWMRSVPAMWSLEGDGNGGLGTTVMTREATPANVVEVTARGDTLTSSTIDDDIVTDARDTSSGMTQSEGASDAEAEAALRDKDGEKTGNLRSVMTWDSFEEALEEQSTDDKLVILALVDSGFLEMACNFYLSSIVRFHIPNFIFIAVDPTVCGSIQSQNGIPDHVPCFVYDDDPAANITSVYGSKDFHRKTNSRNDMVLQALELGYTVLNTDLDIIFLNNPLADVTTTCRTQQCDVAPLWDHSSWNSGFIYIRPTEEAKAMYRRMIEIFKTRNLDDQIILNDVIAEFAEQKRDLKVVALQQERYVNGHIYFMSAGTSSPTDKSSFCSDCYVIHNNWVKGREIKIQRFKEHGLWFFDMDRYYSDPDGKYIAVVNPQEAFLGRSKVQDLQWKSIRNALAIAAILNRTLILPLTVNNKWNATTFYRFLNRHAIPTFCAAFEFREWNFLRHPYVPDSVRESMSATYVIENLESVSETIQKDVKNEYEILKPRSPQGGPTVSEIRTWLQSDASSVLSLYGPSLYATFEELDYGKILGDIGAEFFEKFANI